MRAPRGGGRRCPHPARLGIRPRSGNRGVARAAGPGTGPPGYARRQARDRLPACGGIVRLTSTGTAESTDVASARPQPGPRLAAWQALLVAIAGGLALAAAFPPAGWWPLAAVGPALLAIALWRQRLRIALAAGLVFGLAFFFPLLSWLVNVAWYAWVALAVVEAIIFAVLTAGQWLLLRLRAWPLAVAGWWVACEAARGRWPWGGFPWGRLVMSQATSPAVRWVAVGGPAFLTFLIALVGGCLAWLVLGS